MVLFEHSKYIFLKVCAEGIRSIIRISYMAQILCEDIQTSLLITSSSESMREPDASPRKVCTTSFLIRTVSPSEEKSSQVTRKWMLI